MQTGDAGNHAGHFIVVERWLAAYVVPRQQELERDLWIDAMHNKWPVSEAMVELRSPSLTPSRTKCRQSSSERRARTPRPANNSQRGNAAIATSSGECPRAQA